ncbi:MAG: hypothetical protein ACI4EW_06990, partial [Butyrivibrio sp.]
LLSSLVGLRRLFFFSGPPTAVSDLPFVFSRGPAQAFLLLRPTGFFYEQNPRFTGFHRKPTALLY